VGDRKTGPGRLQHEEVELYLPVEPIALSKLAPSGLTDSQPFFFNVQRNGTRWNPPLSPVM
jgi:hypothetical protein